jgi:predicted hotdog family 3-hydroxylacyl-ACP dehydratase
MPAAIEEILPHRTPMRFIDALTDCTDTTASATATFTAEHFAVADGTVLESALVECVAQTVAAALGHRAMTGGEKEPRAPGMLVAVSNFKIHSRPLPGKFLQIEVSQRKRLGPMLMVSGNITCEGQTIASGDLTLYA